MNTRLFLISIGSLLTLGFGFGFGLGASHQPIELTATGTPIGTFVLRYNLPHLLQPPLPKSEAERLQWDGYIA